MNNIFYLFLFLFYSTKIDAFHVPLITDLLVYKILLDFGPFDSEVKLNANNSNIING